MRSWRHGDASEFEFAHPGAAPGEYIVTPPAGDNAACATYPLPFLCLYVLLAVIVLLLVGFGLTWFSVRGVKEFGWPFIYGGLSILFGLAVVAEVANRSGARKHRSRPHQAPFS